MLFLRVDVIPTILHGSISISEYEYILHQKQQAKYPSNNNKNCEIEIEKRVAAVTTTIPLFSLWIKWNKWEAKSF